MEPFNFKYAPIEYSNHTIESLIDFFNNKPNVTEIWESGEYEINPLIRLRSNKFKSLYELRNILSEGELNIVKQFVEPCIATAEADGVKGCYDFFICISGNHPNLPKRNGVYKHCHTRPSYDRDLQVYTIIYPLLVKEPVTDYIWTQWIDNEFEPISYERQVSSEERHATSELTKKYAAESLHEPLIVQFPSSNEQLIINFNGSHWFHSVEDIKENLYLFMIMNDVVK